MAQAPYPSTRGASAPRNRAVTHAPSGRPLIWNLTRREARRLARELRRRGYDVWAVRYPAGLPNLDYDPTKEAP